MASIRSKKPAKWVSLVGDLKLVTDFLASKPFISLWLPVIYVDALCRGFAEVLFASNSVTGFLVILGLFIGDPLVTAAGVFSTTVALITSVFLQQPRGIISAGLTSYSAVIVGTVIMALAPAYIHPDLADYIWLFLFFGAIFSVYLTIAMANILRTINPPLPCCTLPFNVVTFITLFCFRLMSAHEVVNDATSRQNVTADAGQVDHVGQLFLGTLVSMSQVYAVESWVSSIILYLGLLACSPISCVMAFIGSAIGTFVGAAILGPPGYAAAYSGLLGFNSLLSAAGVGGFFFVMSLHTFCTAVLCALFTIVIQLMFATALVGLPVCTLPFVTSTILFMATTTQCGGLRRPKSFSFPEMHRYLEYHAFVEVDLGADVEGSPDESPSVSS